MSNPEPKFFSEYTSTVRYLLEKRHNELHRFIFDPNINEVYHHYDNWDGGQEFYNIVISIPIEIFDSLQQNNALEDNEKLIYDLYHTAMRGMETNIHIQDVVLKPKVEDELFLSNPINDSFWKPDFFRLFISHVSANKVSATNLKKHLAQYGIDSFVAHEDIEPSKEWIIEIDNALFSMDALCAIVVPDFIRSQWCDQEVGIALGQRKPVFAIDNGAVPYGFFGKYQALKNKSGKATTMAHELWIAITRNEGSKAIYFSKLISLILNATDADVASQFIKVLSECDNIDKSFIERLHSNLGNSNILNSKEILAQVNPIFEKFGLNPLKMVTKSSLPFPPDDDLPF